MGSAARKSKPTNLRPRFEPATLEDALFAAEGLTDDREQQIAIAVELTALPEERVRTAAEAFFRVQARRVVIETGNRPGGVVVEMKAPRRIVVPPRTGLGSPWR